MDFATNAKSRSRAGVSLLALLAGLAMSPAAMAQSAARPFAIPSQSLATGLTALGEQAGISIAAPSALVSGKNIRAVQGNLSVDAALAQMLANSGLHHEFVGANAVRIVADRAVTPAASALPPVPAGVEEVVVTGTRIRGQAPVGSELVVLDRTDIARAGRATVSDLVKTIPQVQSIGAGEGLVGARGQNQMQNPSFASSVNLRGLGADATLVLVNGRRVVPTASGAFVDVSQIPLAAIQRLEVLPDGASALYGSDAIGGVLNFVLRKGDAAPETGIRYGVGDGFHETTASQSFGHDWGTGSATVAYEFFHRTHLAWHKRDYYRSDLTALGGNNFNLVGNNGYGAPGTVVANNITYAVPRLDRRLTAADLVPGTSNVQDFVTGSDILPQQERHSVVASLNQDLGDNVHLFADTLFGVREFMKRNTPARQAFNLPATSPYFVRPAGSTGNVQVRYSFIDQLTARMDGRTENYTVTAGGRFDLPKGWSAELYGSTGRDDLKTTNDGIVNSARFAQALASTNLQTAFNPFGANSQAVLDFVEGHVRRHQQFDMDTLNAGASGALFSLPGGEVRVALGGEYRKERLKIASLLDGNTLTPVPGTDDAVSSRRITSGYVELLAPLVGTGNAVPGVEKLQFSAAARTEHYSDFGTTTDPKLGAMWQPVDGLQLRGSWGTSFKAPRLVQLNESGNTWRGIPTANAGAVTGAPSTPAPGFSNVVVLLGLGDRNLRPETASTWSVGADLAPKAMPGFKAGATWFQVNYKNRILGPTQLEAGQALATGVVNGLVPVRNPTQAQLDAIYNSPQFFAGDQRLPASQVLALVSLGIANYGAVRMRGLDANASYEFDTRAGKFTIAGSVTYVATYELQRIPGGPFVDVLSTTNNPNRWRGRGSVNWEQGALQAGLSVNYTGSYDNAFVAPVQDVKPWTTADARLAYNFGKERGLLGDASLTLDVENVFDRKPPFVNNSDSSIGYDPESASPRGRVISLSFRKTW